MNLSKMTVKELSELSSLVSVELESRKKKLAVIEEVTERLKEMGLEVSDLLNHFSMKKKRGRKPKNLS